MSRQSRILRQNRRGIVGADKEDVQRHPCLLRQELALRATEVESSERLVNVHCPTTSPNEPWDRNTPSVRVKVITTLAADHSVDRTTPIELRSTFAEPKQGAIAG